MKDQPSYPKGPITQIYGQAFTLRGDDIDTDRIIPARFLKCISFTSLGDKVFADDRSEMNGHHPFDLNINKGASILVVNDNFGCGSSREHAPQALMRWGIRALIGQSFAEIFYGNCLSLGIPCATASAKTINAIQNHIENDNRHYWTLKIKKKKIFSNDQAWEVDIQQGPLEMLATGKWDAISQLMSNEEDLLKVKNKLPYLNQFKKF